MGLKACLKWYLQPLSVISWRIPCNACVHSFENCLQLSNNQSKLLMRTLCRYLNLYGNNIPFIPAINLYSVKSDIAYLGLCFRLLFYWYFNLTLINCREDLMCLNHFRYLLFEIFVRPLKVSFAMSFQAIPVLNVYAKLFHLVENWNTLKSYILVHLIIFINWALKTYLHNYYMPIGVVC